mmetsp:Transcript_101588/g.326500  ORF Transcript_101588/g.326500 Transcript_101588/m.326500 type:complete len:107 (+) Transcript_101588:83-403(+)
MVYLNDFEEFMAASQEMFATKPLRTRYLVTYRHCDAKVILKVTDDKAVLKFKTDQLADNKKVERFSQAFARWTVMKDLDKLDVADAELEEARQALQPAAKRKRRKH